MPLIKNYFNRSLITLLIIAFFSQWILGSVAYKIQPSNPLYESWRWNTFTELGDKGIRCIIEGKDQSMWFGTGKGLFHYDGLHWENYFEVNDVLKAPVYGLCYTSKEILYAVTPKGICHYNKSSWQTDLLFPESKVLGSEWEILNITETRNGEI